jgi:hypothetical protein
MFQRTFAFMSSKRKTPDLLREVGLGRRVRGVTKKLNMMGGILPEKQDESRKFQMQNAEFPFFIPHSAFCILRLQHRP